MEQNKMGLQKLIEEWFERWRNGEYLNLPLSENFRHTSPFGTIEGKSAYLQLIRENEDKFLGYSFKIHDAIYGENHACIRYTARQGEEFSLDVSEWYYTKEDLIEEIYSYYHIGDISEDRKLKSNS